MNFEEKIIERLKRVEREVERLRVKERPAGGSGVTDHGALTGLSDDDHPQYLLTTAKAADSDKLDGLDSTDFALASGLGAWQSWTPTVTGWAAGYTCNARYCKVGKLVSVKIQIMGTSNSANVYITLPFASVADGVFAWAYAMDNGIVQDTPAYVVLDTSMKVRVVKTASGAPWTGSGGKRVMTTFTYEVA